MPWRKDFVKAFWREGVRTRFIPQRMLVPIRYSDGAGKRETDSSYWEHCVGWHCVHCGTKDTLWWDGAQVIACIQCAALMDITEVAPPDRTGFKYARAIRNALARRKT